MQSSKVVDEFTRAVRRRQLIRDWAKALLGAALIFLFVYLWSLIYGSPDANADAYIQFDAPWENSQLLNSTFTFGDIGAGMIFIIGAIVLCAFNILFINLWKILRRCWLPMLLLACYGSPDAYAAERTQRQTFSGIGTVDRFANGHAQVKFQGLTAQVYPAFAISPSTGTPTFSFRYVPASDEVHFVSDVQSDGSKVLKKIISLGRRTITSLLPNDATSVPQIDRKSTRLNSSH